jgi:copper chaperone CopZ
MKTSQERQVAATLQTTHVAVEGMSCGSCVRHVTRAIEGLTGVVRAEVDLSRGHAVVDHRDSWVGDAGLIAAIEDAGYRGRLVQSDTYTQSDGPRSCCCR